METCKKTKSRIRLRLPLKRNTYLLDLDFLDFLDFFATGAAVDDGWWRFLPEAEAPEEDGGGRGGAHEGSGIEEELEEEPEEEPEEAGTAACQLYAL